MSGLDFDGDYGRQYRQRIRLSIPAYDAVLEIGSAALAAGAPAARSALIIGPGAGEELPGLLQAMPLARFTLLEPSEQMALFCRQRIEALQAESRCTLKQTSLKASGLAQERFDAVVCHHVLHLFPPVQQQQELELLLDCLSPGGSLVISSYSEPSDESDHQQLVAVAMARLRMLGMDETTLEWFLSGRNKVVFSLAEELLHQQAQAKGCQPPQLLLRAMLNRLWLIQKSTA